MVKKIISGAQVGADIAGLRAGKELGLETGGYVTRGCKTKNGYEPHLIDEYGLTELETEDYPSRTAHNVSPEPRHAAGSTRLELARRAVHAQVHEVLPEALLQPTALYV